MGSKPCKSYDYNDGLITPSDLVPILDKSLLSRVVVGLPCKGRDGRIQLSLIAKPGDLITLTEQYEWMEGKSLFDMSTHHIRELQHRRCICNM